MMNSVLACMLAGASVLSVFLHPAAAEEMKISGTIEYVAPSLEEVALGGTKVINIRMPGTVQGDAAQMVEEENHLCFGTMTEAPDGGLGHGTGYCVQADSEGDVWWLTWSGEPGGTTWRMAGGTGKYDGLSGEGTTTLVAEDPDGSWTVRYEGTMVTE